jgi:hypothetical protein
MKTIYKGTISFEVFVTGRDTDEARAKLLTIDREKLYSNMTYLPGSIQIEPTPYNLLEDEI